MRRTEELRGYKVQQYVNEAEESLLRQFSAIQFIAAFPVQKLSLLKPCLVLLSMSSIPSMIPKN